MNFPITPYLIKSLTTTAIGPNRQILHRNNKALKQGMKIELKTYWDRNIPIKELSACGSRG